MESDSLMPCPSCACELSKTYATHFEQQRLMQFLLGLNETYNQCRSQLMMMDPRLNVNKAYFLVITKECQRVLGKSNIASTEATHPGQPLDAVTFFSSSKGHTSGSGSSSHSGSSFKPHRTSNNNLYCDYCNWKGHTRANCFRLHGYPANWKGKRRSPGSITAANLAKGSSPQSTTGHVNCSHGSVFEGQGSSSGSSTERSQLHQRPLSPSAGISYPGSTHALMSNVQPHHTHPHSGTLIRNICSSIRIHNIYMQQYQSFEQKNGRLKSDFNMQFTCMLNCTSQVPVGAKWIINYGASKHMVNDSTLLTKFTSLPGFKARNVYMTTGSLAKVNTIGSSQILGVLIFIMFYISLSSSTTCYLY